MTTTNILHRGRNALTARPRVLAAPDFHYHWALRLRRYAEVCPTDLVTTTLDLADAHIAEAERAELIAADVLAGRI